VRAVDAEPPVPLHEAALVGDLVSNSFYYSLVGAGSRGDALRNGALLGLAAGLGAVFLPGPLGLGRQPTDTPATQALTVAWYLAGGLAAGAAYAALASEDDE
jgi:hypothetical protein